MSYEYFNLYTKNTKYFVLFQGYLPQIKASEAVEAVEDKFVP
jgi:hypothetical protein